MARHSSALVLRRPLASDLEVWPPVLLAPMAGITNAPFRRLCARFGAPMCVSEMVTARSLVEQNRRTLDLIRFHPKEVRRSIQLYGTDPKIIGQAVAWLVGEGHVDHLDMNFGCPMKKITRKGGGAALPARPDLLTKVIRSAVENAGTVPVTVKFRLGLDDFSHNYLTAGRIAQEEGCSAVALHARSAAQLYSGEADWTAISALKRQIHHIPVLGNGDIFEAEDALSMMKQTACDGVIIGRGCLGRPWLFRELLAAFSGEQAPPLPNFAEVAEVMLEHATSLVQHIQRAGDETPDTAEAFALRSFRKHAIWYIRGFKSANILRPALLEIHTLKALATLLARGDPDEKYPHSALRIPRVKETGPQRNQKKVHLPHGFLDP